MAEYSSFRGGFHPFCARISSSPAFPSRSTRPPRRRSFRIPLAPGGLLAAGPSAFPLLQAASSPPILPHSPCSRRRPRRRSFRIPLRSRRPPRRRSFPHSPRAPGGLLAAGPSAFPLLQAASSPPVLSAFPSRSGRRPRRRSFPLTTASRLILPAFPSRSRRPPRRRSFRIPLATGGLLAADPFRSRPQPPAVASTHSCIFPRTCPAIGQHLSLVTPIKMMPFLPTIC